MTLYGIVEMLMLLADRLDLQLLVNKFCVTNCFETLAPDHLYGVTRMESLPILLAMLSFRATHSSRIGSRV